MKQPFVHVGIVSGITIRLVLNKTFSCKGKEVSGEHSVCYKDGKIAWDGSLSDTLDFIPCSSDASFSLKDVTIGVHFHWERKQEQTFTGNLQIITDNAQLIAINTLPIEDYLVSVISSEMSATSSVEFLKAHAIISRSWMLSQIIQKGKQEKQPSYIPIEGGYLRWYDREEHTLFDVCADDHCQRYQGITHATNPNVVQAIMETKGIVLTDGNQICDARFSKCCGGITEEFQYAWENQPHSYLSAAYDRQERDEIPDLTEEEAAETWIRNAPDAFCNTTDQKVLGQVLKQYDQETNQFFRWIVNYSQKELSSLIKQKTGMDFGDIIDLVPIERGRSGRLCQLKIVGTKRILTIGKELEIRRVLSPSHLYSSAFVIDKENITEGIPLSFRLTGAGWGHGVGLCQIGAAMMGEQGYTFSQILSHYYKDAKLEQLYE